MEKDIEFNLKSIFNTLDIVELFYHHEQYIYIYIFVRSKPFIENITKQSDVSVRSDDQFQFLVLENGF